MEGREGRSQHRSSKPGLPASGLGEQAGTWAKMRENNAWEMPQRYHRHYACPSHASSPALALGKTSPRALPPTTLSILTMLFVLQDADLCDTHHACHPAGSWPGQREAPAVWKGGEECTQGLWAVPGPSQPEAEGGSVSTEGHSSVR